jgi:hypothetical protein
MDRRLKIIQEMLATALLESETIGEERDDWVIKQLIDELKVSKVTVEMIIDERVYGREY